MNDEIANRAALLTPPGAAAIAVVRLAGPMVREFFSRHFSRPLAGDRCVHGTLADGDRIIDDPVVMLGDDVADINLHGGEWVVRECLELARRGGFEITENAHDLPDAGSMIEREMLAALPLAQTDEAICMLLAQPRMWEEFVRVHSHDPDLKVRLEQILCDRSLWWMLHPPRVAIVGAANVGKSTLANQLFGQERSITADVPGTTRDWIGDWANLDGLPVHLLDTPGQRVSSDSIERAAIAQSRTPIEQADLVIAVLDASRPLESGQQEIISRYPHAIRVINKCDLPAQWDVEELDAVHTVATSGRGVDELRKRVRARFDCAEPKAESPRWWTPRQRDILHEAITDPTALRQMTS